MKSRSSFPGSCFLKVGKSLFWSVLRNHCWAPGPCKNGKASSHNDIRNFFHALWYHPSSPMDLCCVYPICWDMSRELVPDSPRWWVFFLFCRLPLDSGAWDVWQQTLQVNNQENQMLSVSVFYVSFDTNFYLFYSWTHVFFSLSLAYKLFSLPFPSYRFQLSKALPLMLSPWAQAIFLYSF